MLPKEHHVVSLATLRACAGSRGSGIMHQIKLVARFRDGRVLKGTTENFNPLSGGFHLMPEPASVDGKPVSIRLAELKAVFVVQDFRGKPGHVEKKTFTSKNASLGARLRITFSDGEVIVGHSLNYDPQGPGFFVFPADPASNNQRIYVVNGAIKDVKQVA